MADERGAMKGLEWSTMVPPFDEAAAARARAHQEQLTKPPGSLGRLEELAVFYAGARGAFPVAAPARARICVFAADHGVTAEGVSPYPSSVTAAMVSNFVAGRDITLHAENGILGYGAFPPAGEEDVDLYNASGQLVTPVPGTAYFDSTTSFAMARNGRVSTVVLGAFQVSANGDLANWSTGEKGGIGGIGGAMDLAAGGGRVIALCYHREKNGRSKLVERPFFSR